LSKYELNDYVLVAEGITKRYGLAEVLKNVDFTLKKGEVHALLGANGAGKSTLLKILDGVITDYDGELYINGKKTMIANPDDARKQGIGMVHQELSVLPNLTVQENIFLNRLPKNRLGMVKWKRLAEDSRKVLTQIGLDISPATPLSHLSVADRQMVEIARIISLDAPVILLDEPTSALSEAEIGKLFELILKFKAEGRSVIFITHKLDEILKVSDRITILRDGAMINTVAVTDRSKAAEQNLIAMMIGKEKGDISEMFPGKTSQAGEVVLEADKLTKEGVFRDISFQAKRGEICVFTGLKGAKRTEVMRSVFGADKLTGGTIRIKGRVFDPSIQQSMKQRLGMVTEDRKGEGIVATMSVKHNIALSTINDCATCGFISRARLDEKAKAYIEKLNIKTPSMNVAMGALSGGNQQKVVLSKWLAVHPDIIILDEPTRGIDVGAKMEIYRLIRQMADEGTAVIVVSSELPEVYGLADRVYVMREGEMVGELSGDEINNDVMLHMMFGHKTSSGGIGHEDVN
jgi:ABC-type sugar transport system ATPase subunit